ncbi:MAG: cation transporter [Endomicrobium sp.]|jgi:cobalt-zinc-cadmium efflux system protein|nr:cation transporter [Endomicrobium sp.]
MIKIKDVFKLPVVLSISLLLMLAETTGSLFSKSLSLLSYAGLILAVSSSALPLIAGQNINIQDAEGFKRSQFYSISINCIMLFIISIYIIYKAAALISNPRGINLALTCWTALSAFTGLIPCLILLYSQAKKNKVIKGLFIKYFLCALLAPIIIVSSAVYYLKDMYFMDPLVSIFITALIIVQIFFLAKQALVSLIISE